MNRVRTQCLFLVASLLCTKQFSVAQETSHPTKRPVTVTATIQMTTLGIPDNMLSGDDRYLEDAGLVAHFSPDRKRFFIVLKSGNLDHNSNRYSILLFETAKAFHGVSSGPVLTLESSTNDEAIKNPKWLDDNETISFIGQSADGLSQVFAFDTIGKHLDQLTNHPTSIIDYDIGSGGKTVLFKAYPPTDETTATERVRRMGVLVTNEGLAELLQGDARHDRNVPGNLQLFSMRRGEPAVRFPVGDGLSLDVPVSISPDGRYAIAAVHVRNIPAWWSEYKDDQLHPYITAKRKNDEDSRILEYILLNLATGTTERLLGVPWSYKNDGFVWTPDGQSVIVAGAYLPLDVADATVREARSGKTTEPRFVVQVNLTTKAFQIVTDQDLGVVGWNRTGSKLLLKLQDWWKERPWMAYERSGSMWKEVPTSIDDSVVPLVVSYEEDLNTPPRIFVSDRRTQERALLVDLNPQFSEFAFGHEDAITWKGSDGHDVSGGLYLPPDYKPGTRYPLVIQTHGFLPTKFWIDGPWNSAFAAQPLANRGFVVLQVGHSTDPAEDQKYMNTPQEAKRQQAAYEGAIDFLDQKGLIDISRVGIIGFSRTVFYAAYTLTHSKYHFAAATLADGMDAGYFQYRAYPSSVDERLLNGGPPVGKSLSLWLVNAPGFNLDKVDAAVRIETYGHGSVLEGWEWFQGLAELEKPVDFIYLPDGVHTLVKPWERMVSQQGNVDWFSFWLKHEEDPDPDKAEQYARWRELRKLQEQHTRIEPAN
jgi:dipeptidyl aminopeptidase/acylaminoacyl peptidase